MTFSATNLPAVGDSVIGTAAANRSYLSSYFEAGMPLTVVQVDAGGNVRVEGPRPGGSTRTRQTWVSPSDIEPFTLTAENATTLPLFQRLVVQQAMIFGREQSLCTQMERHLVDDLGLGDFMPQRTVNVTVAVTIPASRSQSSDQDTAWNKISEAIGDNGRVTAAVAVALPGE